jgi:hypothetical protein
MRLRKKERESERIMIFGPPRIQCNTALVNEGRRSWRRFERPCNVFVLLTHARLRSNPFNRIKRCSIQTDDRNAVSYIFSANIHRRNLTKGQAAMIMSKTCVETTQTNRQAAMVVAFKPHRLSPRFGSLGERCRRCATRYSDKRNRPGTPPARATTYKSSPA